MGPFSGIREVKKSSGTHEGKIVHEFEGTQSRVSIDRPVAINLNTVEPHVSDHPSKEVTGFIICRRSFLVLIRGEEMRSFYLFFG